MLTEVETLDLRLLAHAKSHGRIQNLQQDERDHDGEYGRHQDRDDLSNDKRCVTVDQPYRLTFHDIIRRSRGEDARLHRAKRSANSMNTESVE